MLLKQIRQLRLENLPFSEKENFPWPGKIAFSGTLGIPLLTAVVLWVENRRLNLLQKTSIYLLLFAGLFIEDPSDSLEVQQLWGRLLFRRTISE